MIIFLDDMAERAAIAYERMTEERRNRVIWCRTVEEAVTSIWDYRDDLTEVMLEHDLDEKQYVHSDREDCGMEVVRFLEKKVKQEPDEFEKLKKTKFIVHTWNEFAGPVMTRRLGKLGLSVDRIPFGL